MVVFFKNVEYSFTHSVTRSSIELKLMKPARIVESSLSTILTFIKFKNYPIGVVSAKGPPVVSLIEDVVCCLYLHRRAVLLVE